ncbi:hypothetical protein F5B20DRAFT_528320 [Whalleya microplaca]|nr:hypothetical protein F5B20DRAFT_528320 [Whalleya microplaca]
MNNFGVIELASTKTTNAPGWAYVPDTGSHHPGAAAAPLHPTNRKRARNTANLSYADVNARQEAKIRKEIEVLDRDAAAVAIPVPPKKRQQSGGSTKHTPNVRKILQSQKTFANHLDDFEALLAHDPSGGAAAAAAAAAASTATSKRIQQQQNRKSEPASRSASTPKTTVKQEDVEMVDTDALPSSSQPGSTILTPYTRPRAPTNPSDSDPLLASRVPPIPSDAELKALLAAPPLSYLEARAGWGTATDDRQRYPMRVFCGVCGYWGRVKCMKCGTRVCALECLETHREECVTRYGL